MNNGKVGMTGTVVAVAHVQFKCKRLKTIDKLVFNGVFEMFLNEDVRFTKETHYTFR